MAETDYDAFVRELHAVRRRGGRFEERVRRVVEDEALLPTALEELSTALEELRVSEEEIRVQNEQLVETQGSVAAARERYQDLFEFAPAAYLVTDRLGIIQEANRRAAVLFGVAQPFLVGRPLAMFAPTEDRWAFRDRLGRLGRPEFRAWQVRVQPRRREPVAVAVSTSVIRDPAGEVAGLRWQLTELPEPGDEEAQGTPSGSGVSPSLLAELVSSQSSGNSAPAAAPSPAPDWDELAEALHRVVQTAVPLLRADGAGLMLAEQDGTLHFVTGTGLSEQTFEQAERDLGEGPCIDAFASGEVVRANDLWTDPRWPRLGPAARVNNIRGVLSAPVVKDGRPVGTCNALTTSPRRWTEADAEAIRAYAAMLSQLIGSASDARQKGELAAQLQFALNSRALIEQAKGILMERHGLDDEAAFDRLRRLARSSERKLTEVARATIGVRSR